MKNFKISLPFLIAAFNHLAAALIALQHALMNWDFFGEGSGVIFVDFNTIPNFIYGLILIIFGLYFAIKDFQEIGLEKLDMYLKILGVLSLIYGISFAGISLVTVFLLLTSGTFMIYIAYKDENYFNSSSYTLDLVIFLLLSFLALFLHYISLLLTKFVSDHQYRYGYGGESFP